MKVKDLIAKLEKLDQNMDVVLRNTNGHTADDFIVLKDEDVTVVKGAPVSGTINSLYDCSFAHSLKTNARNLLSLSGGTGYGKN